MEFDPPFAANDVRHAGCRPQFRGKPETLRRTPEPSQDLTLLGGGEFPWASAGIVSGQRAVATATIGFHPAAHRTGVNAQELGNGSSSVARQHMAYPQSPPPFQFLLETCSPHADLYACAQTPVQEVALLS